VNDVPAMIKDNRFFATVPLSPGANSIIATLTAQGGQTTTQTITVTSNGLSPPIVVHTDESEGVQTLTTTFTVTGDNAQITQVSASGGPVTFTQDGDAMVAHYGAPGVYMTTITATDAGGVTVSKTVVTVVQDEAQMDAKLKALWSGLMNALASGDKATALNYLNAKAKDQFGPQFDALMTRMPEIIPTFSEAQTMDIKNETGEYAVRRTIDGEDSLFLIYMLKDVDGVWRIDSM
jgi:hypothetical protein